MLVGHAACVDDVQELKCITTLTLHQFFHELSKKCRNDLYPAHVKMPSTEDELVQIESAYAVLGLPGACGSMDVVHIPLGRCPHGLINVCTGKEGYPTLGYNVICDHQCRTLAIMPGAYGTINDKTIVKTDDAVEKVKSDSLFTEYSYAVEKTDGSRILTKCAYLVVDGGYLRWKCLQCGLRSSSSADYAEWRKRLESIRKDVECYYGRLNQLFKIMRVPNIFTSKEKIDNMMFSIV